MVPNGRRGLLRTRDGIGQLCEEPTRTINAEETWTVESRERYKSQALMDDTRTKTVLNLPPVRAGLRYTVTNAQVDQFRGRWVQLTVDR